MVFSREKWFAIVAVAEEEKEKGDQKVELKFGNQSVACVCWKGFRGPPGAEFKSSTLSIKSGSESRLCGNANANSRCLLEWWSTVKRECDIGAKC